MMNLIESIQALNEERQYSSTQLDVMEPIRSIVIAFGEQIPEEHLVDVDGSTHETNPHITVKYGLDKETDVELVRELVQGFGPVTVRLGEMDKFESDEYDVLIVPVHSDDLQQLNQMIRSADGIVCTDTFPVYRPHMTIAYMKKGTADEYIGDDRFSGTQITFTNLTFSPPDDDKTVIGLVNRGAAHVR